MLLQGRGWSKLARPPGLASRDTVLLRLSHLPRLQPRREEELLTTDKTLDIISIYFPSNIRVAA